MYIRESTWLASNRSWPASHEFGHKPGNLNPQPVLDQVVILEIKLDTGCQVGAAGDHAVLTSQFTQWVRALGFPLAAAHSPVEISNKLLMFLQTQTVYSI